MSGWWRSWRIQGHASGFVHTCVFTCNIMETPSVFPATFAFRCIWCWTWKGPEGLYMARKVIFVLLVYSRLFWLFWSSMNDSLWLLWSNLQIVCCSLLIHVYQYHCTRVYQYIGIYHCTNLYWYKPKCTLIDEKIECLSMHGFQDISVAQWLIIQLLESNELKT